MKSLPVIVFGVILLFVFSCKKDDPQELILGKWKSASAERRDCDDPSNNEKIVYTNGCYNDSGSTSCEEFIFNADKSFIAVSTSRLDGSTETDTNTTGGTYEIDGNKLTLCLDLNISDCVSFTFSVSENSLHFIDIQDFDNCSSEFIYKK